jgi:hypothetical protein
MATLAHEVTRWLANEWEKRYKSAVFTGIVGDLAHRDRGGYHISIEDNPAGNYSIVRPDDKAPPGAWPRNFAAAIDMNLALADMQLCHGRLRTAFQDQSDPRRRYLNGWNGWNGTNGAGRYDMVTNTVSSSTDDHKWHIHLEIRRRYVTSRPAAEAILSILRGQSKADWIASQQPQEEDVEQTDRLINQTAYPNRTVGNVLADLQNERDWWYADPAAVNSPGPNSCAVRMVNSLDALKVDVALLRQAVVNLQNAVEVNPAASFSIPDDQLERVIRRVVGSLDGTSPAA